MTYDQVGSVRIIADSSGDVLKRIDYDSFGNTVTDSNPSFRVPLGFAGGFYDADTGLIRFGYRDYDPDTGKWTAKDPIFFAGGDTNLYGYVLGDPVNFVDLFGYSAIGDMGEGIAMALREGAEGGLFAVKHAAKDMGELAVHGDPLAKIAFGVATASEVAPLAGSAVISSPAVTSVALIAGLYFPVISDAAQGFFVPSPPPPTPGGYAGYAIREIMEEIWNEFNNLRDDESSNSNCP